MRICCTHPGRHGDLLWALATVRAISETLNTPVELLIAEKYGSLQPLIEAQRYIRACYVSDTWAVVESAPISPRVPPLPLHNYDLVLHLGYDGWPTPDLARDVWRRAAAQVLGLQPLDLTRPWVSVGALRRRPRRLAVGFTDEWFELKAGILVLSALDDRDVVLAAPESRWAREFNVITTGWLAAAGILSTSRLCLGDCSALHVLAVALGIPVLCLEPNPQRHADVFYPCGKTGSQVRLLLGSDGLPTFDARHCADALKEMLTTVRSIHETGELRS